MPDYYIECIVLIINSMLCYGYSSETTKKFISDSRSI